jgi:hypothetical protein
MKQLYPATSNPDLHRTPEQDYLGNERPTYPNSFKFYLVWTPTTKQSAAVSTKIISNRSRRGHTDPGAPGRRGRVALERRGAAEEYQPQACVPRRALLPDGRQGRERVTAAAPRPVLLRVHRRVHHRVPRRRPGASRRPGRGRERRGGLAPAAAAAASESESDSVAMRASACIAARPWDFASWARDPRARARRLTGSGN